MSKIPQEQLTREQRDTLEKLEKSRKHMESELAEVLKRHGVPHGTIVELRCGFPPPVGCYCKDEDSGWYCCDGMVGGSSG
jgi:hypothetical protein